ncbi:MAG: hypothetical protein JXR81_07580 [Candidatus Goldbacteria bacterium]|nr:hypothetical protein [Candidatus Goldiibacteriota bacterium]
MGKKPLLLLLTLIPVIFIMLLSCGQNPAPAPSAPAAATSTPTNAVTPTVTPVVIADFEESMCITSIECSDCTNQVLGAKSVDVDLYARNCITLSGEPVNYGTKAYSVSATALNDNNAWLGAFPQTRSANGVGSDFSAYNRFNFSYKVNTNAPVTDKIYVNITLQDPSMNHRLEMTDIELNRSGDWGSLSLYPYTFTNTSTTLTTAQVLAIVEQVKFYIHVEGNGLSTPFVEFIFDNVTMSKQ